MVQRSEAAQLWGIGQAPSSASNREPFRPATGAPKRCGARGRCAVKVQVGSSVHRMRGAVAGQGCVTSRAVVAAQQARCRQGAAVDADASSSPWTIHASLGISCKDASTGKGTLAKPVL